MADFSLGREGSWEENSDRWDRVVVFRHIVPYKCGCIVAFAELSFCLLPGQMEIAHSNAHPLTYEKNSLTYWLKLILVFTQSLS